jgi:hypothetical protein
VRTLALFCKVVDNFGDIGICWRLARQLVREHGVAVTLWVDDLASFHRICPQVDAAAETQDIDGVRVRTGAARTVNFPLPTSPPSSSSSSAANCRRPTSPRWRSARRARSG